MKDKNIQPIRGMSDVLPGQTYLWEYLEDAVRAWLQSYGYLNIRTPILEKTDLFVRSIGETTDIVEKEMYTFTDRLNGESLTLRPEGTASCVRAVVQHNLLYSGPQRLYYMGPMFRHERPQQGRFRQFHQVGVEALGYHGPDIDAEHIIMCERLWNKLGLTGIKLRINTLGSMDCRARYRERLKKYLIPFGNKLGDSVRNRVERNPLRVLDSKDPALQPIIDGAPRLLDDLDEASRKHFDELQAILRHARVAFEITPSLVRGLDYYNLTVFEWVSDKLGAQNTVCAGGRYDTLVEQLGGKPAPACGYAMGIERLLALLQEGAHVAQPADVYLVHQGEAADKFALQVAEKLRDSGIRVIVHCGGGSFKSQMKRADSSAARFAVIIGDDEAQVQQASLKPLRERGEQIRTGIKEIVDMLRKHHV
ncbi:MAG TPA: histidine--tRNA ligase [Burkholderiales bacterium]|nr:histidine--tRNA ligase [Burkholderiales bacterium]